MCQDDAASNTIWLCDAIGGEFNPGVTCAANPCDVSTCCFGDGSCEVLEPDTCTGAGGIVGTSGGSCDPNCCAQSESASELCANSAPAGNVLDTASTALPIVLTLSGDTSDNINGGTCSVSGTPCRPYQVDGEDCPAGEFCDPDGECTIGGTGPREFQTFEITADSSVEIDWCCTEGDAAPGFRWVLLVDDCDECNTVARDASAAITGCPDGNPGDAWPELAAGVYNYQVFTDRYCQNSGAFTVCTEDADCPPGEGPCFQQSGPYQLHITATALPDQVCCMGSVCIDSVNTLECEAMGGFSLDGVALCVPVNACLLGSCCVAAGECEDLGSGISEADCLNLSPQASYVGGATCSDVPCPACVIDDDENCQRDTGSFIVQIDRAVWTPPDQVDRWADDIAPLETGPLDRICWWPAFFNPDQGVECSAPGTQPADDWQLRVYGDDGGYPGPELGSPQTIIPDAKVSLGSTSRVWQYSAPVTAPPVLQQNTCYWIEITGAGEGPGGCRVYWALSGDGNSYSVNDLNNMYGPEDVLSEIPVDPPDPDVDLSFCIGTGLGNCDLFLGACCLPDLNCQDGVSVGDCQSQGGLWIAGETCEFDTCPTPDACVTCETAIALDQNGEPCENGLPCERVTDTSFCDTVTADLMGCRDAAPSTPIGAIAWFSYTMQAGETGTCTLSTCEDSSLDGVIAVYDDCGVALTDEFLDCGDDTCGIGGGPAEVTWLCCEDTTYYFAVGGWEGDSGQITMDLSIAVDQGVVCDSFTPAVPLANDIFDVNGGMKACVTDADCQAGEPGPDPQTVCRDSTGDGVANACYVARQRFLSVKPNPSNAGSSYAYRVSLDTAVAGSVVLGFVQEPINFSGGANPGPDSYDKALIDDAPYYQDWTTLISGIATIGDCEVSPNHDYLIQGIYEGLDTGDEGNYSLPLELPTSDFHGDVTGGGNPGSPPNGAQGNLVDVFAIVLGFQGNGNEPLDWLDIEPNNANAPNLIVSLADAFGGVQAFQQNPYPGPDPQDCP